MKKFLAVLSFVWICIESMAQIHSFGFQGGINRSNITAKELFDQTKIRKGFAGGLKYDLFLPNNITLGADLIYFQKGFINELEYVNEFGKIELIDVNFDYDYISLPLKLGYTLSFGDKIKIIPQIGIGSSILVSAITKLPKIDESGHLEGIENHNVKDKVSNFDFAGLIGMEVIYVLATRIDFFGIVSGKHSFTTFSNKNYFDRGQLRHQALMLTVGLKYKMLRE